MRSCTGPRGKSFKFALAVSHARPAGTRARRFLASGRQRCSCFSSASITPGTPSPATFLLSGNGKRTKLGRAAERLSFAASLPVHPRRSRFVVEESWWT
jgi:hypothetical protein